jgi:lipoate-protein ligase A
MKTIIENTKLNELFGPQFEFIEDGFHDGDYNMKFDLERTMGLVNNESLPMFRLYAWNPWTVSLGANQKEEDINLDSLKRKEFGLVRRPTGGRAVLHANEITYSAVLDIPKGMTVQDVYREIHLIIINSLKTLGADSLDFEKSQADFLNFYKNKTLSMSCFASSARYEVEYEGRKIVGSAQRTFNNTLLQHGSILIGKGHEQIAELANLKSEQERSILKNFIIKHSATIEEILGRNVEYKECEKAISSVILNN